MGKSGKIAQYRERLDKTLASPELTNPDALKSHVQNLLLCSAVNEIGGCSENVVDKRTDQVSHFLDMLRSTSINENQASKPTEASHGEWKLKDDNEEYRVMYRPGPEGTPFHTLLVEGYVDGPVDACLCISWESTLYKKWWPQFNFPPFKITMCECLQKVRIGEQISLVRVKVTWPLSAREAIVHFFLVEYLEDGLILVLLNTISDLDGIDIATHGFTKDGIPAAKDVVRIDVVGGFAIQKVNSQRSYFRTIATMDMKLDFVPPSLINFISRQLVGSGFRLYQKIVGSISKYGEDYSKALEDPVYARIREVLYSTDKPNEIVEGNMVNGDSSLSPRDYSIKMMKENMRDTEQDVHERTYASEFVVGNGQVINKKAYGEIEEDTRHVKEDAEQDVHGRGDASESVVGNDQVINKKAFCEIDEDTRHVKHEDKIMKQEVHSNENDHVTENLQTIEPATSGKASGEIEEEESEDSGHLENASKVAGTPSVNKTAEKRLENLRQNAVISSEVEHALETLEKVISMIREYGSNVQARFSSALSSEEPPNLKKGDETSASLRKFAENDTTPVEDGGVFSNAEVSVEVSEKGKLMKRTSHESNSSNSIRRAGSNSHSREVSHNKVAPASPEQHRSVPREKNPSVPSSSLHGEEVEADIPIMDLTTQQSKQTGMSLNGMQENCLHEEVKSSGQKKHRGCCFGISSGKWVF